MPVQRPVRPCTTASASGKRMSARGSERSRLPMNCVQLRLQVHRREQAGHLTGQRRERQDPGGRRDGQAQRVRGERAEGARGARPLLRRVRGWDLRVGFVVAGPLDPARSWRSGRAASARGPARRPPPARRERSPGPRPPRASAPARPPPAGPAGSPPSWQTPCTSMWCRPGRDQTRRRVSPADRASRVAAELTVRDASPIRCGTPKDGRMRPAARPAAVIEAYGWTRRPGSRCRWS